MHRYHTHRVHTSPELVQLLAPWTPELHTSRWDRQGAASGSSFVDASH